MSEATPAVKAILEFNLGTIEGREHHKRALQGLEMAYILREYIEFIKRLEDVAKSNAEYSALSRARTEICEMTSGLGLYEEG